MTISNDQKLIEAVQARDYETVRTMIDLKADPDYIGIEPKHDPALVRKSPPSARGVVTIDDGNFNTPGFRAAGKTPLYIAVANDDLKMVGLLLEAGANPNKPISGGLHPLNIAADGSARDEITELLVKSGADPNARSPYGNRTPLMARAGIGMQFNLISLMLQKGGDASLRDDYGKTAADHARTRLEGGGLLGFVRQQPLLALFHAVAAPKEFFVDSTKDYYQTRRTIRLLEKASRPKP